MRKQANEIEEYTDFDSFLGSKQTKKPKPVKVRLFNRITVSRCFRQKVAEAFPALGDNLPDWRMMEYLFFGACDDRETGKRLLAHETLAIIAGHRGDTSNFRSGAFLEKFRSMYFSPETFRWTSHVAAEKCRQVETLVLPESLQAALADELARKHYESGRVYFEDGLTFSEKTQRKTRKEKQAHAKSLTTTALSPEAADILAYLNNLSPNLFTRIVRQNHAAALNLAQALENPVARKQQLDVLKHIYDYPQPFYGPSTNKNTDRVFGQRISMTLLARDIRNAITQGWHKADLRSVQLAINASLWNVPELKDFLHNREQSVWKMLSKHFDLTDAESEYAKPAFKEAIYATCYGMAVRKIARNLTENLAQLGIARNGSHFTKHPLIKALLAGRKRATDQICQAGGGKTCFGRWINTFDVEPHRILAQISQALEVKIVQSVFEVAQTTRDFTITLFLHDGFAVHFTDKTKITLWKQRLTEAVATRVSQMGIDTCLEWESASELAAKIF